MVSIDFSENIKIVRKYLNKNMLSIELTQANKFVLTNYKNIKKINLLSPIVFMRNKKRQCSMTAFFIGLINFDKN